ncbi:MAG: ester cyclase [Candidatus Thorarchaeota archaeon]|jgi:predicted ester cyclase
MTVSENIELVKQASEAYNRDGAKGMAEFMDESVVDHFATGREPLKGKKAFVEDNVAFAEIFADLRAEITNIFGQEDWVCIQGIMTGTHQGPFTLQSGKQIQPTGKTIRIPICNVIKLKDGKITEIHEYFDQLSFMTQLEAF